MKDSNSTRSYSTKHEESVCKALGAWRQPNSGAGHWRKGDVVVKDASLLIECKCCMSPKDSVSIKKEWIAKNKEETWGQRLSNSSICFNFEPDGANYYVIDEKLMKFLTEKLAEEENLVDNEN